jgi:hypothetical protein
MAGRTKIALFQAFACLAFQGDYASAKRKVEQIEGEKLPARSIITFSLRESNAYAREEARKEVGDAITNPKLEFAAERVTGSAWIDFVKARTNRGEPPGFLLRALLRGEKHVSVTARVRSWEGKCQVDLEAVEIAGIPVSGRMLDLIIEYYLTPRYPEAVIGKPFELRHRLERIDVGVNGVSLKIGK